MKIIRRPQPSHLGKGTALTIGNFDGVHSGHAELLRQLAIAARQQNLISTVVTLQPHPREFFNPEFKLDRISTLRDKIIEIQRCGIEQVCILPFNKNLAALAPQDFVQNLLVKCLNVKQMWVGDDFRFGAQRAGNLAMLKSLGQGCDFTVHDIAEVQRNGSRVSSSNIRNTLKAGNLHAATQMLGHSLIYSGHVLHGKKLGRTLGFPTLNLRITGRASALTGIWAVQVHGIIEHGSLPAVASMGFRPTVEQSDQLLLETYIPGWQGNAYGKLIHVEIIGYIRPEQHFDSLETLTRQMHQDTEKALILLASHNPQTSNTGY